MPYLDPERRRKKQREWYHENRAVKHRKVDAAPEEKKIMFATRLPAQLVARMQKVKDEAIATGRYPWHTMSAVHEALLLRGFESMAGDPFFDEMQQFLKVMSQINVVAQQRREAQAAMGRFKVEIGELLKIRAKDQAVQYYHGVHHDFESMSGSVWRDWALAEMAKAYPHLAKETPRRMEFRDRRTQPLPAQPHGRRDPEGKRTTKGRRR